MKRENRGCCSSAVLTCESSLVSREISNFIVLFYLLPKDTVCFSASNTHFFLAHCIADTPFKVTTKCVPVSSEISDLCEIL